MWQPYPHHPFNHIVKLIESTLSLLKSSSHYPGETAIRIDSYPAGGVFLNTNPASPSGSQTSHLWYDSRVASPNRSTFSENHSTKVVWDSNPPWTYANGSPHILTRLRVPGLSRATRLRGRNDLSGQLSVRLRST